jgi:branched-subunit amino acid aminotransferase/4-amino-4-deoxychorismate lyase
MAVTTSSAQAARVEIEGAPATAEQLRAVALGGFGHFTAMQVRAGAVRGLGRHLARLDAANLELFGAGADAQAIRSHVKHALAGDTDASVRVYMQEADGRPVIMVTVRPPGGLPGRPWRLRSVPYQRPLAHLKHAADFGQDYYRRLVQGAGFDEALLTGTDGLISEGSMTNVCFAARGAVIWPAGPGLPGITMQLVQEGLTAHGVPQRHEHVRLSGLASFTAAFVTNARGIEPVGQIDGIGFAADAAMLATLRAARDSAGWDPL